MTLTLIQIIPRIYWV